MRLTNDGWLRIARLTMFCLVAFGLAMAAHGQAVATTTVQGTVYLANGQPGGGTLTVSWPAFTTSAGQLVAADQTSVTIGNDGFASINLAPNQGATPAGQYYTAVFYMSDGTVNTQYWIVPAAAQATLAQVQAQVMPAAQAVQAVSKAYVDQAISEAAQSALGGAGGVLTGPLFLSGDPTQPLQAADKHYVDSQVATAVPLAGGNMSGPLTAPGVNGIEVPAGTQQTTLQATINAAGSNGAMEIPPTYAGTDTFTNPDGVRVTDLRTSVAQQIERSVKEFGAVCDGVTDDTNALQSAINYAQARGVALTIPEGTCKTRTLMWHGESIGGLGKQVSALMGFPGQDVLATSPDNPNIQSYTRLHDLTIYVDQSQDVSCSPAEGRAAAGSCQLNRPMESNTIFSPGGNGLKGTSGNGTGWAVGNCAIAMQATTGAGGNGLKNAQIENLEIVATGTDPMATQYSGAHSTHTCGLYLAQWPQWSEFKNIDIRGLNTGVAIPALPEATPSGLLADSNRWQNITIQATHGFTAAAGCNGILDDVTAMAGNSAATAEPPTGIILDLSSTQEGWTVRNAVVVPSWTAVQPALTVTAATGSITAVAVGPEHGLGWDPYGTTVLLAFSGSCTAQASATVNNDGSIGAISVTQGGSGCSSTTTASINAPGNWNTAAPVNLIGGHNMTFFAGSMLRGHGGYTVWNATGAQSYGTQVNGGGGNLPGGGSYPAFIANNSVGSTLQVDQFPGADFGAKLQACVNAVNTNFGGTCDARNFTGSQTMSANLTISTPNTSVLLPCATITTADQVIVSAGTRNVALRGCAMRGGSAASGSQGGTAFAFSGTGAVVQVGDPTYAVDTPGFHMDNSAINITGSTSATAQGLVAYRTQEIDLEDMYFLGNSNQTGMTLDGTGNYAGGTIRSVQFDGFQTAVNAIGHQVANPATTDWMNASTFVRLHIDCPTSNGNPIAGTIGINLQQGDGNTFTGGDVEGCSTALHLGPNAQNNTMIGLRNENSTSQVVADKGSAYNNWITGGTMFTGQLTDNGTRNSFEDTFHRSFNGMNGDWYGSQQDATVTNHFRLGTGAGNERGLLNEYQTDYGYRWTEGLSDATGGEQFYQILDQLNNVYRLSIGQYNNGQSSTNNQTVMNSAGTGAVVLNATTNSGTGGVIFGAGGASPATVATIDNSGDAQFNGTLLVGGTSQSTGTMTVRNNADAEVDYYLWPGLTTSQKGSFTYKDWNGNSQWYMVKDSSNNWALNSALGGLDSFKAYQSTNSGDTYINASNSSGHIRLNYEAGSGAETDVYSGSSSNLVASFLGPAAIKFPGLAAGSGHSCLQIDSSGYMTNTGVACGSGTVSSGNSGQIAYYSSSGTTIAGISAVPVTSGGTGSTSAAGAMANLGGYPLTGGTVNGPVSANVAPPGWVATSNYVDGGCNLLDANGDTRCQPGSDFGTRLNNCLSVNVPANGTCDGHNETGSPTINSTVNLQTSTDVKLPPVTITCNVSPCFESNNQQFLSLLGTSRVSQGRTRILMEVHGPAVLLTNSTAALMQYEVGNFYCDYSGVNTTGPSTDPDDSCVTISSATAGVGSQNYDFHDIYINRAYYGIYDGNCSPSTAPACTGTYTGTNSNVIRIDNVKGVYLGSSIVSFGNNTTTSVHDQLTITNSGANGTSVADGTAAIYVKDTGDIDMRQVWVWHMGDTTAGETTVPSGSSAVRVDNSHGVNISTLDLEDDYLYGTGWLVYFSNTDAYISHVTSWENVFGGAATGSLYQAYVGAYANTTGGAVHVSDFNPNWTGDDTCSSPNSSFLGDIIFESSNGGTFYLDKPWTSYPAMPTGTGCTPNTQPASGYGPVYDPNGQRLVSGLYQAPSFANLTVNGDTVGDLACAVAADSTINPVTPTAGTSTSSAFTFTISATPKTYYVGQKIEGQGNTPSGYNGGPFLVTGTTSTTVTVSSANNPGSMTGYGTFSLYCGDQTNDALASTPYEFTDDIAVPANTVGVTQSTWQIRAQGMQYMPSSGAGPYFKMLYNTTLLASSNSPLALVGAETGGIPIEVSYDLTALSPSLLTTTPQAGWGYWNTNAFSQFTSGATQPVSVTTTSAGDFYLQAYFPATGVVSGTYTSGGSISGSGGQTCTLSAFNDSSTATATVALTGTNTIASGTSLTITSRGQAATAAPTSATLGSGTATCSGTATISTTLGGAPGNAVLVEAVTGRQ
ncbi:MAG: hypothetical protein ACLQHF_16390 [Terracidiphilus sp.]